jgi:cell division protein FtsI/penicillin-binding protein 2
MANWPSFVPGGAPQGRARTSEFNPAYMGVYEPGSMFKVLTLAKALDSGAVDQGFSLYCSGELALNQYWRVRCDLHNGTRAHGSMNLEEAIARSCNVCAATWALRVGYGGMVEYLERLGLLAKPGLGLPQEQAGMFNRDEYAKRLQIATLGFGQSLNSTPLSLAAAFAALANDGVRMPPRLIDKVGAKAEPLSKGTPVVSPPAAGRVMRLMESVFYGEHGTGKDLRIPGYRLAGKTGTAQKTNQQTRRVGGGGYVSGFVGYVPAKDPRVTVLVMIDNPRAGGYYGALVAGPVFVDLARAAIRHFNLPPTEPITDAEH